MKSSEFLTTESTDLHGNKSRHKTSLVGQMQCHKGETGCGSSPIVSPLAPLTELLQGSVVSSPCRSVLSMVKNTLGAVCGFVSDRPLARSTGELKRGSPPERGERRPVSGPIKCPAARGRAACWIWRAALRQLSFLRQRAIATPNPQLEAPHSDPPL
jgi:hypothetical protein